MGKPTGFLDYPRRENPALEPVVRVERFDEYHLELPLPLRVEQGGRCMDCGVPFCQSGYRFCGETFGCPLHNLIPEWNDMIWRENDAHALERLLKTNNFPEFTGRVCPALCEKACTCAIGGQPVTIRDNERFLIDRAFAEGNMQPRLPHTRSEKRIAVIGSGPAGLACADQLNHRGHRVTVIERDDRPGGLLLYGIPNMKLPKDVVLRRTKLMEQEGVEFLLNTEIRTKAQAKRLLEQYDAVVLCTGASQPRPYEAASTETSGVEFAVPYLKAATKTLLDPSLPNPLTAKDLRVVVIGAGDTSSDCVATAIRQGCASVTQLIRKPEHLVRQTKGLWGELQTPKDDAVEEAIAVFGCDPRRFETIVTETILDEEGRLCGVKTQAVRWHQEDGKLVQELVAGTEDQLETDLLLIAGGFAGCELPVLKAFGLEPDSRGNLCLEGRDCHRTACEQVFTAGDLRRGASLVVWAIAEGRATAREVDDYLMGYSNL